MRKIDIHCHTTNRKLHDMIPQSAWLDEIESEMNKHDIEKTILLATYFPHRSSGISNFRLHNWISQHYNKLSMIESDIFSWCQPGPKFLMFGSLDFEHYFNQGINELEELASEKAISGIKIYTCYQQIDLDSEKMKSVEKLANSYHLPLMFHVGYSYSAMRSTGQVSFSETVTPLSLESVIKRNPETDIIMSHMGKPFLGELIRVVKSNIRVYTDMSGLIDSKYDRDDIPECIENITRFLGECGPKKLFFGTDFPVQTHEDSIYFIEEAMKNYSAKDKEDVYYNNARRILK